MESGKKWDLAVVDLEYNIGASNPSTKPEFVRQKNGNMLHVKSNQYTKKDWDNKLSSSEYINSLKNITSNQIVFGGNYYGLAGGYIVWDKLNGESDQFGCELAYQSFNKRTDIVRYMWQGMFQGVYCGYDIRKALIQQGDKRKNEERIHPTQKPVIIYRWILQKYAKAGDTILDTHGGSMSSAIACDMEGFELDICELDKEYFEKAVHRFKLHELQLNIFTN
jgi:site-specific DNA-methyltransferase (adenine-specific)